jgi:tripartite-type tricarboxylate transporter receptor subunit TctC
MKARAIALATAFVSILAIACPAASSQAPRTIKIVVPFPPGGPGDTLTRLLSEHVSRVYGPTIVIENRPGASGRIGTEVVSRAQPDGNTLLIAANNFLIDPHLRAVNYDPVTSFEPICHLTNQPYVLVVDNASPYHALTDLLAAARSKPDALTMSGVGPASTAQIAFEMLRHAAHVNITFVPYAGSAPAMTALLGSHVTSALVPYTVAAEYLKLSKLCALSAVSRQRIESLPDVPAIAESGYKDIEADLWIALLAPARTPQDRVSELANWFAASLKAPDLKEKLVSQGQFPVGLCGTGFGIGLRKQYDDYGRVIREANIKAD